MTAQSSRAANDLSAPNDLEAWWLPFTANRSFKSRPRMIARAKDMHYYTPEGRAVMNRAINDRYEGQGNRVVDWLRQTFHYPDAPAQQEALDQVQRTVNRPSCKPCSGRRPVARIAPLRRAWAPCDRA